MRTNVSVGSRVVQVSEHVVLSDRSKLQIRPTRSPRGMSTARAGCEDPDAGASDRSTRLIMLQRAAGNRAVGTLISSLAQPGPTSTIQNLAISRCGGKPCACDEEPISNQEAATGRLIQREEVDPADVETAPISLPPNLGLS